MLFPDQTDGSGCDQNAEKNTAAVQENILDGTASCRNQELMDFIRYGVYGTDMKTLAKKMDKIISDDKNRRLMGNRAEEIIKRFRRDRILDKWEKLFSEMKNH